MHGTSNGERITRGWMRSLPCDDEEARCGPGGPRSGYATEHPVADFASHVGSEFDQNKPHDGNLYTLAEFIEAFS